ncbi:MAG: hypothetical protein WC613_05925 [Candidatus Aenigmatarchaeota archaeon]
MKKIADWKDCRDALVAKNIKPDEGMVKSLLRTSREKMLSSEMLKIGNVTAVSKFTLAYDSMREALEALAIRKGYKIYNHECYTYFLKEVIGESSIGDEFDSIRKIRNNVNYYGKSLTPEKSESLIKKIKGLRDFVLKLLNGMKIK